MASYWTNDEILWQGAFWSESRQPDHTLQTGLHPGDFAKPFNIYHADGTFRTRQVSYFTEMLSFKFWQNFGLVFLRNYTLILIHILNALLTGILVFWLTRSRNAGWAGGLLALNSGAAMATLVYPFRNAKLLVMTFFLLGWIILAWKGRAPSRFSGKRLLILFTVLLLGLLTDEIAFFFFPILFFYIGIRFGLKGIFNRKIILGTITMLIIFAALSAAAYHISVNIIDTRAHTGEQSQFIQNLAGYLTNAVILSDITKAFFTYFLPRNYGYWDQTLPGILATLAALTVLILMIVYRPAKAQWKIVSPILLMILIKAFLFPHNAGYHRVFMPEGTVFPSLFFFSYYYIYAEALLFALALGILMKNLVASERRFCGVLLLIGLIGFSNITHLKDGPEDALKFMRFEKGHKEKPQEMVKRVIAAGSVIKDASLRPVYLSFPVGNKEILLAKRNDPFQNLYARMIPFRYLKALEKGHALVSYANVPFAKDCTPGEEMRRANTFYDVISRESFPVKKLRDTRGPEAIRPLIATRDQVATQIKQAPGAEVNEIVFFIKGHSGFLLEYNTRRIEGQQTYGNAYQMFRFDTRTLRPSEKKLNVRIHVLPVGENTKSFLIGPFLVTESY